MSMAGSVTPAASTAISASAAGLERLATARFGFTVACRSVRSAFERSASRRCFGLPTAAFRLTERRARCLGCGFGRILAVVERRDLPADQVERRAQAALRVDRRKLAAACLDGADLQIDQVADPAVGADLAPAPGDFPDHARALAHRRQMLLDREAVDRGGGEGARFGKRGLDRLDRLRQRAVDDGRPVPAPAASARPAICSIRATASSTMRVSALRLRLAYSPRNQRPREVSMKASLIAS